MFNLAGKRAVVMGLGHFGGGVGVTRWLLQQQANVLVTDLAPPEKLAEAVAALQGLPVTFRLGSHEMSDFTRADVIVVNPAVDARNNPYLQAALAAGATLTSEIRLLTSQLPNRRRTIGITGSAGKSTTTAMVGHILRWAFHPRQTFMGGNLGGTLLDQLPRITSEDWIVLELSSFMLEGLAVDRWSPHVAAVTNLSANHLDRHGTLDAYRQAKQAIFDQQQPGDDDAAIFGPGADTLFHSLAPRQRVMTPDHAMSLVPDGSLLAPGSHNRLNAALAATIVELAIGLPPADSIRLLADFPGLPHRLQMALQWQDIRFYNDSKSTTPASALMAMQSFPPGVLHVILGGYDKGADLSGMARFAGQHCRAVYTLGVTGDAIADACVGGAAVHRCRDLDTVMAQLMPQLHQGDVVLLSPGCASWDQFSHFERRGNLFVELALRYTTEATPPPR
ncbi:MAG: UDP-N-acetylmuramoyl-L-alanine--D-glutamate ligase [Phycisphaeraceae bacterium]|nr:UDP-N-acetylmuramoyl-L-alanine--D-glutamate ligase [Phycisphaeraceae bacterium]